MDMASLADAAPGSGAEPGRAVRRYRTRPKPCPQADSPAPSRLWGPPRPGAAAVKVTGLSWMTFRLPLRTAFQTASGSFTHREGLALRLNTEGGIIGFCQ